MAAVNGSVRTKRNTTANRARMERSATDRLGKKARTVTKDLQEMGEIAKDAARETLGQLRENASEYCEVGQDKVQQAGRSFEQYVQERPIKSILIATGIGLLLGRFWMRR